MSNDFLKLLDKLILQISNFQILISISLKISKKLSLQILIKIFKINIQNSYITLVHVILKKSLNFFSKISALICFQSLFIIQNLF